MSPNSTPRRTVLVTGASRGLGQGVAEEFARRGYDVMVCARDEDQLRAVRDNILALGARADYVVCDVTVDDQIRDVVRHTVDVFGRIDIAVLNAGISKQIDFNSLVAADFRQVMMVNLFAVLEFISQLVPIMKSQGAGTIVGISSLLDSRAIPGVSAYIASKASLSLTLECAAIELKPLNIRIVNVRPGFIRTDMTANNKVRMPFLMNVDRAARIIVDGILKGKQVVSFPWPVTAVSALMKIVPGPLWKWIFRIK